MTETPNLSRLRRSNLGRDFNFRYPYHRWIAGLGLLAGLVVGLLALAGGQGWLTALGRGFNAGAAAFVAWVLARELDPPRQWTGLVAGLLGGLASAIYGPLPLLAAGFLILPLRLVNQAAGFRSSPGDRWAVALFGILVMLLSGEWLVGLACGLALLLDSWLDVQGRNRQWLPLLAVTAATVIYLALTSWPSLHAPETGAWLMAGLAGLFTLLRLARRRDLGPNDRGRPLDARRVAWSLALAYAIALLGLLTAGLPNFGVLWLALIGVGP